MNAKQEILDALENGERYSLKHMPAHAEDKFARIREILSTHTLEPIDERPFDPTLCGFERIEDSAGAWSNGEYVIYHLHGHGQFEEIAGACQFAFPWPATQSDGERLFRLLGVTG